MDHFYGRAKADESLTNCWALTPTCHGAKTANRPEAIFWWRKFLLHCVRHCYWEEADRTLAHIRSLATKASFGVST